MHAIPASIDRAFAALTFATAFFLISTHSVMAAWAAARAAPGGHARVAVPLGIAAYLSAWLALAIAVGDGGNFPLPNEALRRPLSALVSFAPMLLGVALLFRSKTLRATNDATPAEWLIRVQTYRVEGLMFLFPFLYFGVIPAGFAVPAAVGDFVTGLLAPFVASAVARRRPASRALAIAWNIFGIADLVVAPLSAVLTQAPALDLYPMSLVPLFIGPPLGILTHVLSLRTLSKLARPESHGEGASVTHAASAA
jgi:hypothetical protein